MDLNSVSSNKVVLNIRTPQGGKVPLNKGEVLQTQVQDVGEDGLVTIVVKGKLIEAAAEVPVKPGQQLLLMVDDVRNGKTYLKVVTPEIMGKIENANISAHLLDMGIAAKGDAILLSRKLLQYNLPVNQSNLNELNKNITLLGGMNARNAEIAAFALSRGITGKPALESLAQFFAPQADTAKLIPVLANIMDALAAKLENRTVTENKPLPNTQMPGEPNIPIGNLKGEEVGKNISKSSPAATKANIQEEPIARTTTVGDKSTLDEVKGETASRRLSSSKTTASINTGNRIDAGGKPNPLSTTPGTVYDNEAEPGIEMLTKKNVTPIISKSTQMINVTSDSQEATVANMDEAAQQSKNIEPKKGNQGSPSPPTANKTSSPEGLKTQTVMITGYEETPDLVKEEPASGRAISNKITESITTGSRLDSGGKNTPSPTIPGMILENEAKPVIELLTEKEVPKTIGKSAPTISTTGNPKEAAATFADKAVKQSEELNNTKLASPINRSVASEETQRSQKTASAGNKIYTNQVNADVIGTKTFIIKGNILAENRGGSVNEAPTIILEPEQSAEKNTVRNQTSNMTDNNRILSSVNKSEAVVGTAAANNVEEQLPGVQTDKASTLKPEPSTITGRAEMPINERSIAAAKGMEVAVPLPGWGSDADLPQEPLSRNIRNVLDALRSLLEINPEDPPDKIAGKIQEAVLSEKDIIKALTLLKDIVDSKDISEKLPQLKDFALRLNSLEKEITGQQLFNISNKNASDNLASFYFSFPVPVDQGYSLCQLKISKDGRQRLRDADRLSLVVSLDTAKLGVVLFHVQWQKTGHLELQGVVENQASCRYLNKNADQLVKSLEALGYRVKHQGVKVSSSSEEIRNLKPVLQEVTEPLRPLGIDVTV